MYYHYSLPNIILLIFIRSKYNIYIIEWQLQHMKPVLEFQTISLCFVKEMCQIYVYRYMV